MQHVAHQQLSTDTPTADWSSKMAHITQDGERRPASYASSFSYLVHSNKESMLHWL
jgi:hypothetical protein